MFSEKVPYPVRSSRPTKMSDPTPAESSPGSSTNSIVGPPSPMTSMRRNAPTSGEPKKRGNSRKTPSPADDDAGHGRRIALQQVYRQYSEPAADGDQRSFGSEHDSKAERGKCGSDDAEEVDRIDRPTGLEALGGLMAGRAREVVDRQGHQEAAQCNPGERPPQRFSMESKRRWKVGEDLPLDSGHSLQEEVGDGRHRGADDGAKHQEGQIAAGLEELERVAGGRGRFRRSRRTGHDSAAIDARRSLPAPGIADPRMRPTW